MLLLLQTDEWNSKYKVFFHNCLSNKIHRINFFLTNRCGMEILTKTKAVMGINTEDIQ